MTTSMEIRQVRASTQEAEQRRPAQAAASPPRRDREPAEATGNKGYVQHGTHKCRGRRRYGEQGAERLGAGAVADRSKVLLRFAERLLDRQAEVLDLIQLENGKARRHAFEEIIDVAQVSRYYAARPRATCARTAERALCPR